MTFWKSKEKKRNLSQGRMLNQVVESYKSLKMMRPKMNPKMMDRKTPQKGQRQQVL
jgi:hypothetical protein